MTIDTSRLGGVSARGEVSFPPGVTTWVVPEGVTSISAVAVGPGGQNTASGGGGGALSYVNDLAVTPGETLTIQVGQHNDDSFVRRASTDLLLAEGASSATAGQASNGVGDVRHSGAAGGSGGSGSGGGAAGYGGDGNSGTGGSGASGAANAGGGGVGLFGQGSSGTPNTGQGGSGGQDTTPTFAGGVHGGGGRSISGNANARQTGGIGAVRVVWPGATRQFPNTDVGPS